MSLNNILSVAITSAVIVLLVMYSHAYFNHKKAYLLLWCLGWYAYFLVYAIRLYEIFTPGPSTLVLADQTLYIMGNFMIGLGTLAYIGQKISRSLLITLVLIVVINGLGVYWRIPLMMDKQLEIVTVSVFFLYSAGLYIRERIKKQRHYLGGALQMVWGLSIFSFLFMKEGVPLTVAQTLCSLSALLVAVVFLQSHYTGLYKALTDNRQQIDYLSFHDKLTGLYTRNAFEHNMEKQHISESHPVSVIMGDMNGLKLVNDTFGHQTGDQVLRDTAGLLKQCAAGHGTVYRWGGDEFVVVFPETNGIQGAMAVDRIKSAVKQAHSFHVPLSISLGLAVKTTVQEEWSHILHTAETLMYQDKLKEGRKARLEIIFALEGLLIEKEFETREHMDRLKNILAQLGKRLNISTMYIDDLVTLAALHDIGKITIADSVLKKHSSLSPEDWAIIRRHPEAGYRIAQASEEFAHLSKYILYHHEHWDGTGYPDSLKGKEIPFLSRVLAVVDAYDVMTHDQSYKKAMSQEQALHELARCAGTQFDPEITAEFIRMVNEAQQMAIWE